MHSCSRSEVKRLEASAAKEAQDVAARATERERQLHTARCAAGAAEQKAAVAQVQQQVIPAPKADCSALP